MASSKPVARCSATYMVALDRVVQCDLPDGHADGHRGEDSYGWFGWFDAHDDGTPTSSMSVSLDRLREQYPRTLLLTRLNASEDDLAAGVTSSSEWVERDAYDRLRDKLARIEERLGDTEEALDEAIRQRDAARAELDEAIGLVHQSKDDERRAAQRVAQAEARWHRAVMALRYQNGLIAERDRYLAERNRAREAANILADAIETHRDGTRSLYPGDDDHPIDRGLWLTAVWYRTARDHDAA